MMKFLLVLACVAICSPTINGSSIPDEFKAKFSEIKTACLAEVPGVNYEHVEKMKKHHEIVEDDEDLKKYVLCFHLKGGYMKESGEFNVESIKEDVSKLFGNHDHDKDVDECTKEDDHDAITNSWVLMKCMGLKLQEMDQSDLL